VAVDKKLKDFENALQRLRESVDKTNEYKDHKLYTFFRDSSIQRFEFTLEIAWKNIKQFLYDYEGIECRSPKSCIRDFFSSGYLDESQVVLLLQMVDDRNLSAHTYHEALADEIFLHIQGYLELLEYLYEVISKKNSPLK